jgi:exodeoxyribonuclease VII large subunit
MSQVTMFQPQTGPITVEELTRHIRTLLESDDSLQDIWVQGEISNLSRPRSGHIYFTLKDEAASLRCVMWRSVVSRQSWLPEDGKAVDVHGNISVYEVGGQYQLYADQIRPRGEGALYQEFLRLQAKLKAEGLFDPGRKRPLPAWPRRLGIVTSPTGAALQDIINTLRRRYPLVEVVIAPTPVQGDDAPRGILTAIEALNRVAQPDVILLARGGGSIEDLWAFNDERVARAVFGSQAPIVTGVGHETDFTIADFVADVRAPTPTAAAELTTPSRVDLQATLTETAGRLIRAVETGLERQGRELTGLAGRLRWHSPLAQVRTDRQRLDDLSRRTAAALGHRLQLIGARLEGARQRLDSLNPIRVLDRGFAVVTGPNGRPVSKVRQVQSGDRLEIRVRDGAFGAEVTDDKAGPG